jgi:hypothetical protein
MFICDTCGSKNVQMQMWVDPNTREIFDEISSDLKDNWCDDCEENVTLETVAEA